MTEVTVDTQTDCCVVSFYVPHDIQNPKFLKGRVVISDQDGIAPGDGVVTVGGAVRYILDSDADLFLATNIVKNDRQQHSDDPKWFIPTIEPIITTNNKTGDGSAISVAAVAQLTSIMEQISAVIKQLDKQCPS